MKDLPWEKLSGCNILVTGATGLIGSCLVDMLMTNPNKDYQVYALGRNKKRAQDRFLQFKDAPSFHFLIGDVTQPLTYDEPFHFIIHAASNGSPNFFANNPVEVMKSNLYGVSNLIEYGLVHEMKRFLYVSTGEVYGINDASLLDESSYGFVDILNTRSCYPSSKRAAETLAMCYAGEYGADVVVARPCHTYGPHFTESDNRVYAQFIRNVINGDDIVMKSAGSQYRSWCYVEDCVSALLYILLKGKRGEAYNIADKSSVVSIRELAEMIAHIAGRKVLMQVPSDIEKKGFTPIKRAVFDTAKLEALGWMVNGTMEEKLRLTIDICQANDQGTNK